MEYCSHLLCWQKLGLCFHSQAASSSSASATSVMATLRPPCPSCVGAGPAKNCDYQHGGEFSLLNNKEGKSFEIYSAKPKSEVQQGLIIFSDIFGIKSPQVQFVADQLAQDGYLVVVPDFFTPTYGKPWDFHDMPPKDGDEFKRYFAAINDLPVIEALAERAVGWLKQYGAQKIGCVGFCWGGAITIRLASQPDRLSLVGAASVHPVLTTTTQADYDAMKIPLLFCPSNGEKQEHIDQVNAALQNHPEKAKCVFKYFDVKHGYCGTRGDWANNKAERDAAAETIGMISKFFKLA